MMCANKDPCRVSCLAIRTLRYKNLNRVLTQINVATISDRSNHLILAIYPSKKATAHKTSFRRAMNRSGRNMRMAKKRSVMR